MKLQELLDTEFQVTLNGANDSMAPLIKEFNDLMNLDDDLKQAVELVRSTMYSIYRSNLQVEGTSYLVQLFAFPTLVRKEYCCAD